MLPPIQFDRQNLTLRLLDQRKLPREQCFVACRNAAETATAISEMAVRGAPAIGVAAAWGCALAAHCHGENENWREVISSDLKQLKEARPTAVNLTWAVERMERLMDHAANARQLLALWLEEAEKIQKDDEWRCECIGKAGAGIINNGDTVLTHCNAGALATAGCGTALGVIRAAIAQGKQVRVIADETRPFMQGSRLTAYELHADGIPVTLACDNACAHLMATGHVNVAVVGADRIAANGDTANKIGTMGVAILANYFHIPFYVAAPFSTIDASAATGMDIAIEARAPGEVLKFAGMPIAPEGVGAFNFAFDVTPAALISGIITEYGILRPPYGDSIASVLRRMDSPDD